jgi:hypothetical protein
MIFPTRVLDLQTFDASDDFFHKIPNPDSIPDSQYAFLEPPKMFIYSQPADIFSSPRLIKVGGAEGGLESLVAVFQLIHFPKPGHVSLDQMLEKTSW